MLQEQEMLFLADFIEKSIFNFKFLKPERIPNLIQLLEKMDETAGHDQQ